MKAAVAAAVCGKKILVNTVALHFTIQRDETKKGKENFDTAVW